MENLLTHFQKIFKSLNDVEDEIISLNDVQHPINFTEISTSNQIKIEIDALKDEIQFIKKEMEFLEEEKLLIEYNIMLCCFDILKKAGRFTVVNNLFQQYYKQLIIIYQSNKSHVLIEIPADISESKLINLICSSIGKNIAKLKGKIIEDGEILMETYAKTIEDDEKISKHIGKEHPNRIATLYKLHSMYLQLYVLEFKLKELNYQLNKSQVYNQSWESFSENNSIRAYNHLCEYFDEEIYGIITPNNIGCIDSKLSSPIHLFMQDYYNTIIVQNINIAIECCQILRAIQLENGFCNFINMDDYQNKNQLQPNELHSLEIDFYPLEELVYFKLKQSNHCQIPFITDNVYVCKNTNGLNESVNWKQKHPNIKVTIITQEGEVLHADDTITACQFISPNISPNSIEQIANEIEDIKTKRENIRQSIFQIENLPSQYPSHSQYFSWYSSLSYELHINDDNIKQSNKLLTELVDRVKTLYNKLLTVPIQQHKITKAKCQVKKLDQFKNNIKQQLLNVKKDIIDVLIQYELDYHFEFEIKNIITMTNKMIITTIDKFIKRIQSEYYTDTNYSIEQLKSILDNSNYHFESNYDLKDLHKQLKHLKQQKKIQYKKIDKLEQQMSLIKNNKKKIFDEYFIRVQQRLPSIYGDLTQFSKYGVRGQASISENIFNENIEFVAIPPGKTFMSISCLSGGEQSIANIALQLACIESFNCSPFILMDEMDMHLDGKNVRLLSKYILQRCINKELQMICVSHKLKFYKRSEILIGVYVDFQSKHSKILGIDLIKIKP